MGWMLESAIFFPSTFNSNWAIFREMNNEMTNAILNHIHLYKVLKEEQWEGNFWKKGVSPIYSNMLKRENTAQIYWSICLVVRVFTKGPEDCCSILGRVIPKTQKMVLDISLLNTWHYKAWIKGKVEQSRERSSTLPYILVL